MEEEKNVTVLDDNFTPKKYYPLYIADGVNFCYDKFGVRIHNKNGVGFTLSVDPDLTKDDEVELDVSSTGICLKKKEETAPLRFPEINFKINTDSNSAKIEVMND